jgi:Holliday junction DNA helicase RuvA
VIQYAGIVIVSLEGRLVLRIPLSCVIDVQGIGYEVFVPLTVDLPEMGEGVKLFTYAIYREDSQSLYGFNRMEERDFFKLVIDKVSGIGPKTALAMLSKFKLSELKRFIAAKETQMLASVPGIGKKTAEKVILELSDKVKKFSGSVEDVAAHHRRSDAILGLIVLGYKRSEAEGMVAKVMENFPDIPADQLIRKAIATR